MSKRKEPDSGRSSPPPVSSKRKGTSFRSEYKAYHGIVPSIKGASFARCNFCNTDFTINHGGEYDIKRHVDTDGHKRRAKATGAIPKITSMFKAPPKKEDLSLIRAEATITELMIKMNVPMSFASEFTKAVKTAFPDSDIAQKYACGRTKASAIASEMSRIVTSDIISDMKAGPFSFATDGSNDAREKQFPIVVTTAVGGVKTRLLGVPTLRDAATGENIFELLKDRLEASKIPWSNCISFGTDSASVMVGCRKGVSTRLQELNKNIYLSPCVCHLIHHAAEHGVSVFEFSIEDVLTDIYFYLLHSSKRQQALEHFQNLEGIQNQKILKHVSTRWLSIGKAVNRLIENWDALKEFLRSEKKEAKKSTPRLDRLCDVFVSRSSRKLYFLFLQSFIGIFEGPMTILQTESPQIHALRRILNKLLNDLLVRFVKPAARYGKNPINVDYRTEGNLLSHKEMMLGSSVRDYINTKGIMRQSSIDTFHAAAVSFYQAATDYVKANLPINDQLLMRVEVADIQLRRSAASHMDLMFFLDRYPCLVPKTSSADQIQAEFLNFQADGLVGLPVSLGIDKQWEFIGAIEDTIGNKLYSNLTFAMLGILTIPHSNAAAERVFSCVRKNKTDQRASMGKDMLESLMVVKSNSREQAFTDGDLGRFKGATSASLKKD